VKVPFNSSKHAEIARRVLQVDAELQPNFVQKHLTTEGDLLVASFSTITVRLARLSLNSFLENLDLVVRTLGEYADEAEQVNSSTAKH
ncbi:transcription factor Pcc1, partial [Ramaria rubella]